MLKMKETRLLEYLHKYLAACKLEHNYYFSRNHNCLAHEEIAS